MTDSVAAQLRTMTGSATPKPALVDWCSDHETYTLPREGCPGDGYAEKCHVRKRLMYICPLPGHDDCFFDGGRSAFFDRADLLAHMNGGDA